MHENPEPLPNRPRRAENSQLRNHLRWELLEGERLTVELQRCAVAKVTQLLLEE